MDHIFHIHLVSDSTGETLHAMTTAALAQFEDVNVRVHPYALVRSEHQLTRALDHIAIMPGIVFFTLANQTLRDKLVLRCTDIGTRAIDVLNQLNLRGFQLAKPEGGMFAHNDNIYDAVSDGQKLYATKSDVEAGR